MNAKPFVSIIIPCRNEEQFIGKCLDSILLNDYPKEKREILVVDGMSSDGTRVIIENYAEKYHSIMLLDNPKKITPSALNRGIEKSVGEFVLWMSAHNEYKKDYVSKCVEYMEKFNTDAVGGIIKTFPREEKRLGSAICTASSHPFGVGSSAHKTGTKVPKWVDTAFGVCYKREVFDKIGTFNEKLVRGQDMEFSLRMKKAGLQTLLAPDISSTYYIRSDFKSFWKHTFKNGVWAILPLKYTSIMPVSWRHLVPLAFVTSVIVLGFFSLFISAFFWVFLFLIGLYIFLSLYFSTRIAVQKKDFTCLIFMPFIFSALHTAYGLGSLAGICKTLASREFWTNKLKKTKT